MNWPHARDIKALDQSKVDRLEITPLSRAIALKERISPDCGVQLSGLPLSALPLTWSSSDASVAAVDANGVVAGL